MFDTNVTGLVNMTQAIMPIFLKRADGGQGDIVNVGSIAGREPYPGGTIYCATKAAVRSISESLRKELIATRVRVIEVDPGQVETVRSQAQSLLYMPDTYCFARTSAWSDSTETSPRPMLYMRMLPLANRQRKLALTRRYRGVEPLTPEDIAEVIVFAVSRRENVVVADTLIFPNHQVRIRRSHSMLIL
jgi:3-hydroxy acid dehydrogenase/malonic semialdehyde reductase